jgi:hypothetical protein
MRCNGATVYRSAKTFRALHQELLAMVIGATRSKGYIGMAGVMDAYSAIA